MPQLFSSVTHSVCLYDFSNSSLVSLAVSVTIGHVSLCYRPWRAWPVMVRLPNVGLFGLLNSLNSQTRSVNAPGIASCTTFQGSSADKAPTLRCCTEISLRCEELAVILPSLTSRGVVQPAQPPDPGDHRHHAEANHSNRGPDCRVQLGDTFRFHRGHFGRLQTPAEPTAAVL
eukprot:scpid58414/ scgid19498/ 